MHALAFSNTDSAEIIFSIQVSPLAPQTKYGMFSSSMTFVQNIRFGCSVLLVFGGISPFALHAETALQAKEVIQKAVLRSQHSQKSALPDINYTKVTVTEEFDASGKVTDRKRKVYNVSFRSGLSQMSLVEVNGRAPAEADRRKQSENETGLRQLLGQSKPVKGDNRENFLTPEMVARFDFSLVGQTNINGRAAYQIAFQPKTPEPPVRRMVDRVLNRISGTLWIDCQEFEIARADVFLRSEVNLLGGFAGCLKKLAYTMVRTRIAEGLWFNTLSSGDFEGRKLLDSTHIKTKSQATNFERAS
jgi:hypothetical protein